VKAGGEVFGHAARVISIRSLCAFSKRGLSSFIPASLLVV